MTVTLDELNAMAAPDFAATLDGVFEDAPWVACQAALARPFATVAALHAAMLDAVRAAAPEQAAAFLRGHPELSGAAALTGTMGDASKAEQRALGLDRPADDLAALNAAYRARFSLPFIVCVRRHTRSSLVAQFQRRLNLDPYAEQATALEEVGYITRLRLADRVEGPGAPAVNGSLTTHVLDAAVGRPAAGVAVALFEVGSGQPVPLATAVTNAQGRTAQPLLHGAPLRIGHYELRFDIGSYFAETAPGQPPFLGVVPVRFGIAEAEAHYHIPLLASPGAYSTYRGS
ncbi:MAG: 2-oxo-4-hydroxy-4-carboxy-5-ureidoimidazoline decarboxylase [Janthinobacterium lividum]